MYVESMGRTLQNLFKSYYTQLLKLDLVVATKGDLIAVEEATLKNMFTQKVIYVIYFCHSFFIMFFNILVSFNVFFLLFLFFFI